MKIRDIAICRLQQQHILKSTLDKPEAVVKWFGAVQAQDYLGALWAVGLRMRDSSEKIVEDALTRKAIIRTWPMRGTLHFVAAKDVRWMLKLLTPRIVAANAKRLERDYTLDNKTISRAEKVIVRALEGNNQLSREALYEILEKAGISAKGQRGLHILWSLAHKEVLCFGRRNGKQQTFALLDEWIPATKSFSRNESLAKLASIYFNGHGPATVRDFAWWSGLSPTDATAGYELIRSDLTEEKIDGRNYIMPTVKSTRPTSSIFLLPSYDEYAVGYADRSAVLDADAKNHGNGIFNPIIVFNGKIIGTWKRHLKKDEVLIEIKSFSNLTNAQKKGIEDKGDQFRNFLQMKKCSFQFLK